MNTIKLNTIGERPIKKAAGGGGGNYVYYSGTSNDFGEEITVASVIKYITPENVSFMTNPFSDLPFDSMVGVGFDKSLKISHPFTGELTTVGDFLAELGVEWTQITEEEFYKIPTQFTFTLNGEPKKYDYEEGMTWGEWIDSPYNDGNFSVHDANMGEGIQEYVHYEYSAITDNEYYYVKPTDLIQPNMNYIVNNQVG